MKQLSLQYDPPITIDIDGRKDRTRDIWYIGYATKQLDGKWRCLANVAGMLCLVEVRIKVCQQCHDADAVECMLHEDNGYDETGRCSCSCHGES